MPVPRIILTSGEPAGIGPDLCLAVAQRDWACELIVAVDKSLLLERAAQLGLQCRAVDYSPADRRPHQRGTLKVIDRRTATAVCAGKLDPANVPYVLGLLDLACDGCLADEFDAMVTAPVQKSVIIDAGAAFIGHTEYLAERTGRRTPVMMLIARQLRVALATTHIPLSMVSKAISQALLEEILGILHTELRTRFAIAAPRILVCGLNPHAGESGHLGREDVEIIAPALARLRAQGMSLVGPTPADTVFTPHMLERADAVLAMYHDQGLPVLKYAGFGNAVNVTLGLPIIRTSVDHGTALDLAGTGRADAGSMMAALEMAVEMAERKTGSTLSGGRSTGS